MGVECCDMRVLDVGYNYYLVVFAGLGQVFFMASSCVILFSHRVCYWLGDSCRGIPLPYTTGHKKPHRHEPFPFTAAQSSTPTAAITPPFSSYHISICTHPSYPPHPMDSSSYTPLLPFKSNGTPHHPPPPSAHPPRPGHGEAALRQHAAPGLSGAAALPGASAAGRGEARLDARRVRGRGGVEGGACCRRRKSRGKEIARFGWLVGSLVACLLPWLLGWLLACLLGWLVGCLYFCSPVFGPLFCGGVDLEQG